jgi:hypothetical protein
MLSDSKFPVISMALHLKGIPNQKDKQQKKD